MLPFAYVPDSVQFVEIVWVIISVFGLVITWGNWRRACDRRDVVNRAYSDDRDIKIIAQYHVRTQRLLTLYCACGLAAGFAAMFITPQINPTSRVTVSQLVVTAGLLSQQIVVVMVSILKDRLYRRLEVTNGTDSHSRSA